MAVKAFSFKSLLSFSSRILLRRRLRNQRSLQRKLSTSAHLSHFKLRRYTSSLSQLSELSSLQTTIFDVDTALLKSSSLFPYFMLVAFEAGGLLRALLLLLLYPLVCLVNEDMKLKMMVMVCFCGVRRESFRAGRAVLPKFFLEDVGLEGFEMVMMGGGRKVGVSSLPRVMVEWFLREYLEIDAVVGRELKVFHGYYVGLMEEKKNGCFALEKVLGEENMGCDVVGFGSFNKLPDHEQLFSCCQEIYMVTEADKRSWSYLAKEKYPKPLIFHDGRLALRPTPLATLAIFLWIPFGLFLAITRALVGSLLPYKIALPLLAFSGLKLRLRVSNSPSNNSTPSSINKDKPKGVLYVCNHRTLMDPLYLSGVLNKPVTAVTYSLSKVSEMLAPIKTVSLTRDKEQDSRIVERLLGQGDLVICPEGTTCREPYLLRFSPLFAEMGDEIVPVAMDTHVSMFYGTTASGLKCLDPIFFLMNPSPAYTVKLLEKVSGASAQNVGNYNESRLRVANHVQKEIGKALGFECTKLTRKDKYLILAGNEGIVNNSKKL